MLIKPKRRTPQPTTYLQMVRHARRVELILKEGTRHTTLRIPKTEAKLFTIGHGGIVGFNYDHEARVLSILREVNT